MIYQITIQFKAGSDADFLLRKMLEDDKMKLMEKKIADCKELVFDDEEKPAAEIQEGAILIPEIEIPSESIPLTPEQISEMEEVEKTLPETCFGISAPEQFNEACGNAQTQVRG